MLKKKKVYDNLQKKYVDPSEKVMKDIEVILNPPAPINKFREGLLE